jgi:hypothetical protein
MESVRPALNLKLIRLSFVHNNRDLVTCDVVNRGRIDARQGRGVGRDQSVKASGTDSGNDSLDAVIRLSSVSGSRPTL